MLKNLICPKCSQEFPAYYASQCFHYVCIVLLSCQQSLALQGDCSIREYQSKKLCSMHLNAFCSLSISLTALLESIDLF